MVASATLVLVAARLVGVLAAVAITITSYRAYRRTGERTFQYTMAGFACLGVGLIVESYLLGTVTLTLTEIHAIESLVFAVGFVILYASIAPQTGR
ncbi:DUF7521 family protein [Salinibaculum rarum]|jgi:hypothetical protein|uniref:DUF7521 family protein n=1 Tax=Salinibaculum rarum TaxID=3058903 RepID=UPI00265D7C5F|nr:hypothetical protein [Salinibaculum sp. KK48]